MKWILPCQLSIICGWFTSCGLVELQMWGHWAGSLQSQVWSGRTCVLYYTVLWEGDSILSRVKLAQKRFRHFTELKLIPLGLLAPCRINQMALHGASPSLAQLAWRRGKESDWHSVIAHRTFSMSLCCFPAAFLVQGIIAKRQNGTIVQSQCGSGAAPELIPTARAGVWDRHNWMALLKSAGLYLPCWLCQPCWSSTVFVSRPFNYFGYFRYPCPPYLWPADAKFLSETRLGFGDTYRLMFGKEMLFLSENPSFWLKSAYLLNGSILLV